MKTELLTDIQLRASWSKNRSKTYTVAAGTMLTPAARDFLREHEITLCFEPAASYVKLPMSPVPVENGKRVYVSEGSGARLGEKPEDMTHLYGNVLVPKTDPRITFRGRLDSLGAEILEIQVSAREAGEDALTSDLEELRGAVLNLMRAEVLQEPLPEIRLLGLDSAGIRRVSHHVKQELGVEPQMPDSRMGRLPIALNHLRTQIREAELCAAAAYPDTEFITLLNRLSSCAYILYCRMLAGYYDRRR